MFGFSAACSLSEVTYLEMMADIEVQSVLVFITVCISPIKTCLVSLGGATIVDISASQDSNAKTSRSRIQVEHVFLGDNLVGALTDTDAR